MNKVVVHTNKLGNPSRVDIALVRVVGVIDLNIYTPICLPPADFKVRGTNVTLTGDNSE